jgi:hypothetical protein
MRSSAITASAETINASSSSGASHPGRTLVHRPEVVDLRQHARAEQVERDPEGEGVEARVGGDVAYASGAMKPGVPTMKFASVWCLGDGVRPVVSTRSSP